MNKLTTNFSSAIRIRKPYYIQCSKCGLLESGNYIYELKEKATNSGWKYDYENDKVYCPDCHKES